MDIILDKQPEKYLERIHEPLFSRIAEALEKLSHEPPEGDIKKLRGRADYRLRIGAYRAIFRIEEEAVIISKLVPRGQAYKE